MFTLLLIELLSLNVYPGFDATPALGNNCFRVRQQASKQLLQAYPASDVVLRRTAKSNDLEASERAVKILDLARRQQLERLGEGPWADFCLMKADFSNWDTNRFPWLSRKIQRELDTWAYRAGTGMGRRFACWSLISEKWAKEALEHGVPPTIIKLWFAVGISVQNEYLRQEKLRGNTNTSPYIWGK